MADYLYGSAHVRVLENAIVGKERLARLVQTSSLADAYALLSEFGVSLVHDAEGKILREESLLGILKKAYLTVAELTPDSTALRLWRYPYDCNNLKAAIKCFVREIDPTPMLFDFGTVEADRLISCVEKRDFSAFPSAMQKGADEALDAYAKTRNPQSVDLILDRACFEDMRSTAEDCKDAFTQSLVRIKTDLTNVMMTLRVLRMSMADAGRILLEQALLGDSKVGETSLLSIYESGEDALWQSLRHSRYERFAEQALASDMTLSTLERLADDCLMEEVKQTKFIPVGLEVMVAFLLAHEYEVRNLRIVLAGKEAGLDAATIRERIRESYV